MADQTSKAAIPSAKDVETAHTNADTDVRPESLHHTLGAAPSQASPGNHRHMGGDSLPLFDDVVTGSRSGGTAMSSLLSILSKYGITDSTTA